MKTFFYAGSILGAMLSAFFLFKTLSTANGAPQEAASAAVAACIAIIPYVFARSIEKIIGGDMDLNGLMQKQVDQNRIIIALQKRSQGLILSDQEKALLSN